MRVVMVSILLCLGLEAQAVIYECTDPTGQKTFTDRGCPNNQRVYPLAPDAPLAFAPLAEAEQQRLRDMASRAVKARQLAATNRARKRRRQTDHDNERSAACADALAALEELERLRRKGYPLAKQAQLDQTRNRLKLKKKANC